MTTPSSATSNVAIADLFDVDYNAGSDGLQSIAHQFGLTLKDHNGNVLPNGSGTGVETTMKVTRADGTPLDVGASERTIWLFKQADGSILGVINQNGDGPANDFIALRMYLQDAGTDNPKLVVEQYLPIEHPTAGSSTSAIDEAISLYLKDSDAGVEIAYTVTVTDKDGDSASSTHSIEVIDYNDSIVKIEDDGPSVDVSVALGEGEFAALTLNLDETVQPDGAVNPTYDRAQRRRRSGRRQWRRRRCRPRRRPDRLQPRSERLEQSCVGYGHRSYVDGNRPAGRTVRRDHRLRHGRCE